MDPTQFLIDMLSQPVPKKTRQAVRKKVVANHCLCPDCQRKMWRDGVCRPHFYEIEKITSKMSKTEKARYMENLHRDGLILYPYEIREYRKPESEYRKRA